MNSNIVDKFSEVKILCIGDIMLDKFFYGNVERISPEAPVPVFSIEKEKVMLGGTGNVIANLSTLGVKTKFAGVIGDDESGNMVEQFLKDTNCEYVLLKPENYNTTTKIRMIAGNNHLLRTDKEDILKLNEEDTEKFIQKVEKEISDCDLVLVSDYKKGLLTLEITQAIINLCKKYDKKVVLDPKEKDYTKYSGAYLVKPNLKEFELVSEKKYSTESPNFKEEIKNNALKVMNKYFIKNLLITLSKDGMIFVSNKGETIHIPAEAKEVFDVSGAGDTSLAVLGASLALGINVSDAMKLANYASGIVVGKLGTACVSKNELKSAISKAKSTHRLSQAAKIISLKEAIEISKELKKENKIVGFTNGCFDVLHLGHIRSFAAAKEECDYLFVGINTDNSVKRLRGENWPLQDEQTRAYVVASLEFVDYVVLFNEDTAVELVKAIKPDIIAKEGLKIENWPEAKEVLSYGGRVIELERVEDYSTQTVLNKIENNLKMGV